MFKRLPYLALIVSVFMAVAAVPAMATDEVPAPPPPTTVPPSGGPSCTDSSKPTTRIITSSSRAARSGKVRGTASDRGCGASGEGALSRVRVSVQKKSGKRCRFMASSGRLGKAKSCSRETWLTARGSSKWSFGLPKKLGRGKFTVHVQALDSAGNLGAQRTLNVRIR